MRTSFGRLVLYPIAVAALALTGCGGGSDSNGTSGVTNSVSTLAGASAFGTVDGAGGAARFHNPVNVAVDSHGILYVADFDNNAIRKVTPQGVVTTLTYALNFQRPFGITVAPDGSLYVQTDADDGNNRDSTTGTIWKIDTTTGTPTVVARDIGRPRGLTALRDGHLVLVDLVTGTVRLMDPGTATITPLAGTDNVLGFTDATGGAAKFSRPYGAAQLPNGDIIVADQTNNRIREITLTGVVTTYAGTGAAGSANGPRLAATFNQPEDVDCDSAGNVYVDDHDNGLIRKIAPNGTVSTVAGGLPAGFADGVGTSARFFGQEGMSLTPDGSTLYVADGTDGDDASVFSRVRRVRCR